MKTHILVIEDDRDTAAVAQELLETFGYEVSLLLNPDTKDIEHVIEKKNPDIILMDIVLEGSKEDGIDIAGTIHENFSIPIVYLTGHVSEKILERARLTEPYGYVVKPFTGNDLKAAVEIALFKAGAEAERRRIAEALKWENEFNTTVAELSGALLAPIAIESISKLVLQHAMRLTRSRYGCIGYMDPHTGSMVNVTEGTPPEEPINQLDGEKVIYGMVFDNREHQYSDREAHPISSSTEHTESTGTSRFLQIPLINGEVLVSQVVLTDSERDYNQRDFAFVKRLAFLYAIAVRRTMTEDSLRISRSSFSSIVEKSIDGIVVVDKQGIVRFMNESAESLFNRTGEEPAGSRFGIPVNTEEVVEIDITRSDRTPGTGELRSTETQWENESAYLVLIRDITDRKKAEEKIKDSLREKEILLREIHHRVKNNMQLISSLLNIQANQIQDNQLREIFQDSRRRIRSMAIIHERIYKTEDMTRIELGKYLHSIVSSLSDAYGTDGISFSVATDDICVDIDTAIPCALLLNELVSNAFKHAFPDGRQGLISIEFRKTGDELTLTVRDNGVSFPEDIDFQDSGSVGLQLVNSLVDQLKGTITLTREDGTVFTVTFKA
jgi:two-component sensor histidine kinase/CheY-like chemotaxis protein